MIIASDNLGHDTDLNEVRIDLSLQDISLEKVFQKIELQTNFKFAYRKSSLDKNVIINKEFRNQSLNDVLFYLAEHGNLSFRRINGTILVVRSDKADVIVIQGKVIDNKTGLAIPYVSVGLKDSPRGTSSNNMGEFQLRVDSLPVSLVFRHISYERLELFVGSEEPLVVKLGLSQVVLEGLVVKGRKKENYLYSLITKAFDKVQQYDYKSSYGKAYYRQLSRNGDDYTGLYEIFFDTRYSRRGIRDWAIQEGRYALKKSRNSQAYIYNKNFTLICRILSMIQPNSKDIIHPVNKKAELYYNFELKNLINVEGRKIGVISFKPKRNVKGPTIEGELYLDIENYDLLKIKGQIHNDQLKFVSLKMKGGNWKNYSLSFEIAYKMHSQETLMLDYISLNQSFDYYSKDEFKHPVTTHALLSFYEYYVPETHRHLGGRLSRYWKSDRDVLNKIGYNKDFWEENPIVKRTPVEKEVIASFEQSGGFGSIYLNNKQQVVLEGNELDNDSFIIALTDSLKQSRYASTGEKIFVHTDKSCFVSGETIWFSVYLLNATLHVLSPSSSLVYVELIDGKGLIITQKRVYMEDGGGYGQIDIPADLVKGSYQLRAYTNWMRNFDQSWYYTKELTIINLKDNLNEKLSTNNIEKEIDFQLFAEGGYLIEGLPVQVAFKAIGQDGKHLDVEGNIYNSKGKKLVGFKSEHLGMGSFMLLPRAGESYYAVLKGNEKKYRLSELRPSGFSMMVNNKKPEGIELLINASTDLINTDYYIVAQMRGIIFYKYKGNLQGQALRLEIPKSGFPDGILHITLFSANGIPLGERLVFINNERTPYIKFYKGNNELEKKDHVEVLIQLKDSDGRPVQNARLSVSVTDIGKLSIPDYEEDIRSWLLLNSDLRGDIEYPGYYFESNDKEHRRDLDLLMLTHGWRRFTWKSILKSATPEYSYAHELGINISGRAYKKGTDKTLDQVSLSFIPTNFFSDEMLEVITNADGRFSFRNIWVSDTTSYMIQSQDERERQLRVEVLLDSLVPPEVNYISSSVSIPDQFDLQAAMKGDEYRRFIEELMMDKNTIILNEVEVKLQKKRYDGRLHTTPDDVIKVDERYRHYSNALQLLQGRVAGLMISGSGEQTSIMMRGYKSINDLNTTPLILIDGIPVNGFTISSSQNEEDESKQESDMGVLALLSLSVSDIERIEILKGSSAAIYGSRAANGVIAVYTRRGDDQSFYSDKQFELQRVKLRGFSIDREFYIPNYQNKTDYKNKPDYRSTLFWNPDMIINENGWSKFDFYNNDYAKRLLVVIQGVTDEGVPVSAITWIGE